MTEKKVGESFGRRAKYYATSATHANPAGLQMLVDLAAPRAEWNVLDVGTGPGHVAMAFATHVQSVIGIDLSPEMLAEGESACEARGIGNVHFQVGSSMDIPFEDNRFDLVTCRRAAHHFLDLDRAIDEMRRVLVDGGMLIIDDRSVPEDDFVDDLMNRLDVLHDRTHVREYSPSHWRDVLEGHHFRIDHLSQYIEHRPISSLTDGASDADAAEIMATLKALEMDQREALNLVEVDGQLHLNHWYVVVKAIKE
jgi:ubiquinone/menaquinone biosynthesis C-methylase UbiE